MNPTNPYPRHLLFVFGKQDKASCHYLRGLTAGSFEAFFDEEMLSIELSCISKGDKACVFKIKPLSKWDQSDPLVFEQKVKNRLPKDIFEKFFSWDQLVSTDESASKEDYRKRIQELAEEMKKTL